MSLTTNHTKQLVAFKVTYQHLAERLDFLDTGSNVLASNRNVRRDTQGFVVVLLAVLSKVLFEPPTHKTIWTTVNEEIVDYIRF